MAELERVAAGGSTLLDEINGEYDGLFSFAVYLAAEKRDSRAYGPLARACHCASERADERFGDDAGVQLGRMLASVCDGDIAPIKALAEGSIAIKGVQRNVADLLLGPGGPAFTPGQRSWIEQLRRQPLRLYDITEVLPGVGMRLCDALDTEAAPVMVYDESGSEHAQIGNLIGVRIMEVDGHHEISGAAFPFSRLMNASLLAELHAVVEDAAGRSEELSHRLSAIIRRCWIAQHVRPLPLPTLIDSHSGDAVQ